MVPNPGAITGAFPFPCLNPTGAKTNRRRQRWGCGGLGPAAMCIYHLGSRDGAIPVSGGTQHPPARPRAIAGGATRCWMGQPKFGGKFSHLAPAASPARHQPGAIPAQLALALPEWMTGDRWRLTG